LELDAEVKLSGDDQIAASDLNMMLLMVVIVLAMIVIALTFRQQTKKRLY
jgi:cell division protein FtsL